MLGQSFTFSILFSQYLLSEGVSSTTTAWMYGISFMMTHFMMVMVGPLTQEYGTRTVGFCGVTICIAGMLLSAFTPSPSYLYISTSLLGGRARLSVYCMPYSQSNKQGFFCIPNALIMFVFVVYVITFRCLLLGSREKIKSPFEITIVFSLM